MILRQTSEHGWNYVQMSLINFDSYLKYDKNDKNIYIHLYITNYIQMSNVKILQMFNIHKCSMYYKVYTNPHPPPSPSPTVMASCTSYDDRRCSCITTVIDIGMIPHPVRTLHHRGGMSSQPAPNELRH